MARTQATDYAQRREAIVDRAAALYAERGFLGASIADLAKACKTSKSLIYHYYPSKEDILFDVMDSHLRALEGGVADVASTKGDAAVKLRALTHSFMRLYVGAEARHKVLLNELQRLPAKRRAVIVARQRHLIEFVENLISQMRPDLAKKPELRLPLAMLYFGMINWTHTWYDPKGSVTPDAIADLAADTMLSGIEKK
ncbi:MAG TPA: TetR/AcrR family transcriptional regulator [Rhizomicrobium sp.]|jgi:AcrR family transcriptional regulator|nr:TetR/AcrR family transcriptional regulator [Rhizomicrobium sp.]